LNPDITMHWFIVIFKRLPIFNLLIITILFADHQWLSKNQSTEILKIFDVKDNNYPKGKMAHIDRGISYYYIGHSGEIYETGELFIPVFDAGDTFTISNTIIFRIPVAIQVNNEEYPVGSMNQYEYLWHILFIIFLCQFILLILVFIKRINTVYDILATMSTLFTIYFLVIYLTAAHG
jgi:hypothetical protein